MGFRNGMIGLTSKRHLATVDWSWVVLSGEVFDRAGGIGSILAFTLGTVIVISHQIRSTPVI